jgi:hypothetical protein
LRLPPETGGADSADSHLLETAPLGVAVQEQEIATDGHSIGTKMGGLVAAPAAIDAGVLIMSAIDFVGADGEGGIGNNDTLGGTRIDYRAIRHPPGRGIEGLGNVRQVNAAGILEGHRVPDHAVTEVGVGGDFIRVLGCECPKLVVVLFVEAGAIQNAPGAAIPDEGVGGGGWQVPRPDGAARIGEFSVVIIRVHADGQAELADIAVALDLDGLGLRLGQCGQEHPGKDGDDRDDNEEFDQGECGPAVPTGGAGPGCIVLKEFVGCDWFGSHAVRWCAGRGPLHHRRGDGYCRSR